MFGSLTFVKALFCYKGIETEHKEQVGGRKFWMPAYICQQQD